MHHNFTYITSFIYFCNCRVRLCPLIKQTQVDQQRKLRHLHVGFRLHYFHVGRSVARKGVFTGVQLFFISSNKVTKPTAEPLLTTP